MANIFFGTMLQPPIHLLREIRREFDAVHLAYYQEQLTSMHLRKEVTMEAALQYFSIFQDAFNGYYRSKFFESGDFPLLVQEHEQGLPPTDILLIGLLAGLILKKERNTPTMLLLLIATILLASGIGFIFNNLNGPAPECVQIIQDVICCRSGRQ